MIVGITGFIGSGKDTVADFIQEIDPSYIKMSFANRLKDMTAALYQWDRDMLAGLTEEARKQRELPDEHLSSLLNQTITPRNQLQALGVALKEKISPNIWAMLVKDEIIKNDYKNVLITDCRFPDEIDMIRSLGGMIIEVRRQAIPDWYEMAELDNLGKLHWWHKLANYKIYKRYKAVHASEKAWIGINNPNAVINNKSTLKALKGACIQFYDEMLKC